MSHAWLYTGPPSSGRSNAARAFAAALQCGSGGCGKCTACRTSLSGSHPDVTLVRIELLSIGVDEVRELVRRSAMSPTLPSARPWDGDWSLSSRTPIGSPNVAPMPC
jgi:DNA polymerase III subunit delta'